MKRFVHVEENFEEKISPFGARVGRSKKRRFQDNSSSRAWITLILTSICVFLFWFHLTITPNLVQHFHLVNFEGFSYLMPSSLYRRELQIIQVLPLSTLAKNIPVYYINLDEEFSRRDYIRDQLRSWGFHHTTRVSAWTTHDVTKYVTRKITSKENIVHPNKKEIACIASHLYAMYLAVTDTSNDSPYALIMEDDLNMEMEVDWEGMMEKAPEDFAILQLMTSNGEGVYNLWKEYLDLLQIDNDEKNGKFNFPSRVKSHENNTVIDESQLLVEETPEPLLANPKHQWKLRKWQDGFWSTQAYMINKKKIRSFIMKIVTIHMKDHHYRNRLPNPDVNVFRCAVFSGLCVMPFRLVADILLYTYFQPTYITRIPFLNGASANKKSSSIPVGGSQDE